MTEKTIESHLVTLLNKFKATTDKENKIPIKLCSIAKSVTYPYCRCSGHRYEFQLGHITSFDHEIISAAILAL